MSCVTVRETQFNTKTVLQYAQSKSLYVLHKKEILHSGLKTSRLKVIFKTPRYMLLRTAK